MNIVAIGGGEIRERETIELDKFIRDLTGKQSPKLLFIPTASNDAEGYCQIIQEVYGKELGCKVDDLRLVTSNYSQDQIQEKILNTDIIYVGGGNTQRMMEIWCQRGVDKFLKQAASNGTVLSGISAGAICWHDYGHSDSESFTGKTDWEYTRVEGLGMHPGIYCPHLDDEQRQSSFAKMVLEQDIIGIGCDNNAALWYQDGKSPRVKTSDLSATVKILRATSGRISLEHYLNNEEVVDLASTP